MKNFSHWIFMGSIIFLVGCSTSKNEMNTSSTPITITPHTLAEVKQHNTANNCWLAVDNKVYDITTYIASGQHVPEITDGCGKNATALYAEERKHFGPKAQNLLERFYIGSLE